MMKDEKYWSMTAWANYVRQVEEGFQNYITNDIYSERTV